MGENPKKYHVTDDGDVYRVNEDGSFTSMGNVEGQNHGGNSSIGSNGNRKGSAIGKNYNLLELENLIISNDISKLSLDEVKYIAMKSQNSDAILLASEYNDSVIIPILVRRFEDGTTFLEDTVLCGCEYDKNDEVKLAIANCKRKFNDDSILTTLGKDKNPLISSAAKNNPNYTGKDGGCLGSILIFVITTLSLITVFI